MKITLCRTLMAMALLLLAVSCEKERVGLYQGDQGGPGGASGKQVVASYTIDYSKRYEEYILKNTYGYAECTKFTWSGNSLKGLSWMEYENRAWVYEEDETLSLEYEGDSPTEIVFTEGGYKRTCYITYTDGYPTEIYMVDNDGDWDKTNYSYDSDGKLRTSTKTSSSGSSFSSSFTWTGDNLTAVEESGSSGSVHYYSYTYDTKKSPNNSISLPLKLILGDNYSVLSANNVILKQSTHTYNYSGMTSTNTYSYTYAYTYDGDYPVKCIRTERGEYDEYGDKNDYTYTTYYEYADGTGASQLPKLYEIVDGGNHNEGHVSGDGVYTAGTEAVLYVYANYPYHFLRWSDGVTDNPRHIIVNSNATYTPIYNSDILLRENFDNGIPTANGWEIADIDNDGYTWYGFLQNYGHNGSVGCARSDSYNNNAGALTPTNRLYTPYLDVPSTGAYLTWYVAAQDAEWPSEFYRVYVGVNGQYTQVYSETVTAKDKTQGTWRYRYVNLNSYANKHIDIMFEHTNCTDQFALCIDDVEVVANSAKGTAKAKSKKMRQISGFRLPWRTNHEELIINQQQSIIKNQQQ